MALDDETRSRLLAAKLGAVVRTLTGADDPSRRPGTFPAGASLADGSRAWILIEDAGPRSLGGALVWATHHGVRHLDVIVGGVADVAAGAAPTVGGRPPTPASVAADLARRASWFESPAALWWLDGATPVAAAPAPFAPMADPPTGIDEQLALLAGAGVEIVVEGGIVRGEVLGLEVARIEVADDGRASVAVGIGRFDREISAMTNAGSDIDDVLARAVDLVRAHRRPGGPPHPLRDLGPERWIRRMIEDEPALAGVAALQPCESTVERTNLRDRHPAMATGVDDAGRTVVVAASSGIDVDLVPLAADTRGRIDPDARLVIVAPADDLPASVRTLAGRLVRPAEMVEITPPWR